MSKPITAVLIGAGLRGSFAYGPYAMQNPNELEFVAVAEPDPVRRAQFATAHDIPETRQFASWEDVLAQPEMADVVFNMTQDQMHYASAKAALEAGYSALRGLKERRRGLAISTLLLLLLTIVVAVKIRTLPPLDKRALMKV